MAGRTGQGSIEASEASRELARRRYHQQEEGRGLVGGGGGGGGDGQPVISPRTAPGSGPH